MSSNGDVFTLEDAENDGRIASEVGRKLKRNMARRGGELWLLFQETCERKGVSPKEMLGEHVVRAMRNEEHADALFRTEVDLSKVNDDQRAREDARMVMELLDEFGLDDDGDDSDDPIDRLIEERILSVSSGPLGALSNNGTDSGANNTETRRVMQQLREQNRKLQRKIERLEEEAGVEQEADGGGDDDIVADEKRKDIEEVLEEIERSAGDNEEETEEEGGDGEEPDVVVDTDEDGVDEDGEESNGEPRLDMGDDSIGTGGIEDADSGGDDDE